MHVGVILVAKYNAYVYVGTRFPIEYLAPYLGQVNRIAIQIRFFNEETCSELLKEQLTKYREEIPHPEDEDAQESEQDQQRCQEAIDFFTAMFVDKPPFRSQATMHEFLNQESMDTACIMMQRWLRQLLTAKRIDSDSVSFGAATPADLNELLEPYIGGFDDPDDPISQAVLWLIIESVRVHVSSRILDSGVILVDAPGVSDSNEYRVKVAQSSLRECGHIVVVLNGKTRVWNDLEAKKNVEKVSRRMGSNMTIAVTHSDLTLGGGADRKAFRKDETIAEIDRMKAAIQAKIRRIRKTLKKQPEKLRAEIQNLEMRQNLLDGVKLGRELEIATTNAQQKIQKDFAERLPNRSLTIHNVSNTWYTDLSGPYKPAIDERPPIKSTGIPELRQSIRKIGEKPQIDRLHNHIHSTLRNALTNICLWCDPSQVDISSIARPVIEDSMKDCAKVLEDLLENLKEAAQKRIIYTVEDGMEEWMDDSREALQPYIAERHRGQNIKVVSVNAFINKHGKHKPKGKPVVDLNALLMEDMLQKLTNSFKDFKTAVHQINEKAKDNLLRICDGMIQKIENSQAHLILAHKGELLQAKRAAVHVAITTVFQDVSRALAAYLREFRTFAVDTDHDCCIMQILDPVYEAIKNNFPPSKGYCRARQDGFHKYVQDDVLYDDYLHNIEEYSNRMLNHFHNNNIKINIDAILADMRRALTEFCVPPQISKEELASRAGVGKMVKAKLSLLEGEISQNFRKIRLDIRGQKRKRSE